MKYIIVTVFALTLVISPFMSQSVAALSCLPVEEYLKTVVGDENTVVFTGTVTKQFVERAYTSEVITVNTAHQGYLESSLIAYHQKDETWGFFCNNGPKNVGDTGFYVATRNQSGTYDVTQRLETTDQAAQNLLESLKETEFGSEIVAITPTERQAQILTTLSDLFTQITKLLQEYRYWSTQ